MLKIKILSVGKTREQWLESAFQEYSKRLKNCIHFTCLWAKDDSQLVEWSLKENFYLCLDPLGRSFTSENFAAYLSTCWQKEGSRLTFIIGGAEGTPLKVKQRGELISLSSLTFTHQITRLILIEQIYRTIEIHKGSNYHK